MPQLVRIDRGPEAILVGRKQSQNWNWRDLELQHAAGLSKEHEHLDSAYVHPEGRGLLAPHPRPERPVSV